MSGYVNCACRDCFETAIASDEETTALCWECEAAGCSPEATHERGAECQREVRDDDD